MPRATEGAFLMPRERQLDSYRATCKTVQNDSFYRSRKLRKILEISGFDGAESSCYFDGVFRVKGGDLKMILATVSGVSTGVSKNGNPWYAVKVSRSFGEEVVKNTLFCDEDLYEKAQQIPVGARIEIVPALSVRGDYYTKDVRTIGGESNGGR